MYQDELRSCYTLLENKISSFHFSYGFMIRVQRILFCRLSLCGSLNPEDSCWYQNSHGISAMAV